jgi:hypothetical protein
MGPAQQGLGLVDADAPAREGSVTRSSRAAISSRNIGRPASET